MAKLRHIAINCDDLETSAKFYTQAFELEEVGRAGDISSMGAIYLSDGTINVALIKISDPDYPNAKPDGLNHIGFVVEDLDATVTKAKEFGARTTMAGDQVVPGQLWEFKMETPEGVGLDLYDVHGRGWPGISGLEELGVTGKISAGDHQGEQALAGGKATSGHERD